MKKILGVVVVLVIIIVLAIRPSQQQVTADEYDVLSDSQRLEFISNNLIGGGPPKDGIPSIDDPIYLSVDKARSNGVIDDDIVFGEVRDGVAYAYPRDIMYWHEVVNNDGHSVTYCPLTESAIIFEGAELGVSGKLYNSNLVLYDRETDALIPQLLATNLETGHGYETAPLTRTTFGKWVQEHPNTMVLSGETGHSRDYDRSPYPGYEDSLRIWFPTAAQSDLLPSKELIVGASNENGSYAIKRSDLEEVTFDNGITVRVVDGVLEAEGNGLVTEAYWFAWYAYYPDTELV